MIEYVLHLWNIIHHWFDPVFSVVLMSSSILIGLMSLTWLLKFTPLRKALGNAIYTLVDEIQVKQKKEREAMRNDIKVIDVRSSDNKNRIDAMDTKLTLFEQQQNTHMKMTETLTELVKKG